MRDSILARRLRDLPLRAQLMIVFALLSVATTAISTITLTTLHSRRMRSALEERAQLVARRLQTRLESTEVTDRQRVTRELFDFYEGDNAIDGMAVYTDDGEPIESRGAAPGHLRYINSDFSFRDGHLIAVERIHSPGGGERHLYMSFSTQKGAALLQREIWISAA